MKMVEFFKSIQGEGNSQGVNALFIRFPGCNLRCRSCDTPMSWKKVEATEYDEQLILSESQETNLVVFTGGEPLLQGNLLNAMKVMDSNRNQRYEIETNGTIPIDIKKWDDLWITGIGRWNSESMNPLRTLNLQFNISPKENFEQEANLNTTPVLIPGIQAINHSFPNIKYIVKYLFNSKEDIEHIARQTEFYHIPRHLIWLQPKATMADDVVSIVKEHFNDIVKRGWNISMRTHVLLFNDKKGV